MKLGLSPLAILAFLAGCPAPPPRPPQVDAADGSAPAPKDAASPTQEPTEEPDGAVRQPACQNACLRLRQLNCPEAETPDGGKTCYRLCADAEECGHFSLKPVCVATAKTLGELKACGTVRCVR